MRVKPFRVLLADGKTRSYATAEARDKAAVELAYETGEWVGLETWGDGDWWLTGTIKPKES